MSQTQATAKYNAKSYEEIKIRVHKGEKILINEYAKKKGMSLNRFIKELIKSEMGEALKVPAGSDGAEQEE